MENNNTMNIYQKIQAVKKELAERELKKSGENSYSGFKYYELGDFLPSIIELCQKYELFTQITFTNDTGILYIIDASTPVPKQGENGQWKEEYRLVTYTAPMRDLELKGANAIQALGGVQTYLRRYLYMNAFDIVEADMFDSVAFEKKKKKKEEAGELEEIISKCKSEFAKLSKLKTDAKASKEDKENAATIIENTGDLMKKLGYSTFGDVSKKQEKNDILALADILKVKIAEEKKTK